MPGTSSVPKVDFHGIIKADGHCVLTSAHRGQYVPHNRSLNPHDNPMLGGTLRHPRFADGDRGSEQPGDFPRGVGAIQGSLPFRVRSRFVHR